MTTTQQILFVPQEFPSIQSAVDAITGPATIVVYPGSYDESVVIASKQSVVIQSSNLSRRGVTITGSDSRGVLVIENSSVYLSGIEIRSGRRMRGILATDSTLSLQECVIAGNFCGLESGEFAAKGAGMCCVRSAIRIQKSGITGNAIDMPDASAEAGMTTNIEARGAGVYLESCKVEIAGSTIQANEIYSYGGASGGGIWCHDCRLRVWKSRVTDNYLRAKSCQGCGVYLRKMIACEIGGSVITGNGFVDGNGGGVFIEAGSNNVSIHRNTIVSHNHPDDLYHASCGANC